MKTQTVKRWEEAFRGILLGTAVGDALGLPAENLSPQRISKWWGGRWRMRLVFGRGMSSDDTEHTLMVGQALLAHASDAQSFQSALGWKFRWWFAALPGGVGLATAKACLRLWAGFPASRCAVNSAGSGPAMRSAILGAYFADQPERRRAFVQASSQLTHRSWQAELAALAVAEAVAMAVCEQGPPETARVLSMLRGLSEQTEWQQHISQLEEGLRAKTSVVEFVQHRLGLSQGVTGYSLHVVPVTLYAWLLHQGQFRPAMLAALECGGDTDTVGAILGALCGATSGAGGIPRDWLEGLTEWPRSIRFIERLAERLGEQKVSRQVLGPVRYFWPGLILRNALFLFVILCHGMRRLFPPY